MPASEHSTVTVWQRDGEIDAYRNMVEKFENGIVSIVSDSYDIYNACSDIWGTQLKGKIVFYSHTKYYGLIVFEILMLYLEINF